MPTYFQEIRSALREKYAGVKVAVHTLIHIHFLCLHSTFIPHGILSRSNRHTVFIKVYMRFVYNCSAFVRKSQFVKI